MKWSNNFFNKKLKFYSFHLFFRKLNPVPITLDVFSFNRFFKGYAKKFYSEIYWPVTDWNKSQVVESSKCYDVIY